MMRTPDRGVLFHRGHAEQGSRSREDGPGARQDGARVDRAYDLLDAITAPDAGKRLIEDAGFGHCNRKAFDLVDEETLADRGLPKDPTELVSTAILFRKKARLDDLASVFEAVKSGP